MKKDTKGLEKSIIIKMDKLASKVEKLIFDGLESKKDLDREKIYSVVLKDLNEMLKENGLPEGVRFYSGTGNEKKFEFNIDMHETIKALKKLTKNDKIGDKEFHNLNSTLKTFASAITKSLDDIEASYKGSLDTPFKRNTKDKVKKIVYGCIEVFGAIAAVASVVVLALALFSPPSLIALAATVGVSSAATVAIAGVSIGVVEASAIAGTVGTLVGVMGHKLKSNISDHITKNWFEDVKNYPSIVETAGKAISSAAAHCELAVKAASHARHAVGSAKTVD